MNRSLKTLVGVSAVAAFAFAASAAPLSSAKAASSDASVYIVHGIAGQDLGLSASLPVDISVNGACTLTNFTFGTITGPIALPAGSYEIAISLANAGNPCSEAPVISKTVPLNASESASIVAHLTEAGAPTASKFVNNVSTSKKPRVIVHHTAQAPAVNIELSLSPKNKVNKSVLASNGDQATVDLAAGRWDVSIFLPGTATRVFGIDKVPFKQKTTTLVYAVGTPSNSSFTLLTKTIPAL